jgi:hypothetical protein
MANDPSITYPKIAKATGFSESKAYHISNAPQKEGVIERTGSRKAGTRKVLASASALDE